MLSRREVLRTAAFMGLVAGVGGCTDDDAGPPTRDDPGSSSGGPQSPSSVPSAGTGLPKTEPWQPAPADVSPQVKRQAARLAETAGTWTDGDSGRAAAEVRLRAAGFPSDLADSLGPLLGPGQAATAQVRVAQYGGILTTSASVLVVVDQWIRDGQGTVTPGGTTLDIRLEAAEPKWRVTEVRPARPGRRSAQLPRSTRRLLGDNRVKLPYAAVKDLQSGVVSQSVAFGLNMLASEFVVGVSIVRSGHPVRVFGTDRRSSHTDGLAVDVWSIDGRPVIESGRSERVSSFMRAAAATGAFQVGGPQNLDGEGRQFFSDATHLDHIHVGYLD